MSFSRARFARCLGVVALVATALLSGNSVASAHSVLMSSTPAKDASIASAPSRASLTFNEALEHGFTTLVVLGPDGTSHWEAGPASIDSEVVSVPLNGLGPAGRYTIQYRVISADGHPVSGTVPFTLTAAGAGSPTTPVPSAAALAARQPAVAAPDTGGGSIPVWPWIAGGVALLLIGGWVAMRIAR